MVTRGRAVTANGARQSGGRRGRGDSAAEPRRDRDGGGGRRMRAGGRAAPGALALALVCRCLLLGPLGLRSAGAQDGEC